MPTENPGHDLTDTPAKCVCERCAHTWEVKYEPPSECEACRHPYVRLFPLHIVGNDEAAEEYSQEILDAKLPLASEYKLAEGIRRAYKGK